jgi:hypothetical protein
VGNPYETQIWIIRGAFFLVPVLAYAVAGRVARWLRVSEEHPLRTEPSPRLVRTPSGGWAPADEIGASSDSAPPTPPGQRRG